MTTKTRQETKLLYDEPPLQVIPSLAKQIGLNEALIVQQLHYWLLNPKVGKDIEGKRWIYNSVDQWQEQFPFWSRNTIRRLLEKLEADGVILVGNFNSLPLDKTKWYSLDYAKLAEYKRPKKKGKLVNFGKSSSLANGLPNFGKAIPETTSEIISEDEDIAATPRPEPTLNDDDFYIVVPDHQMVVRVPILPSQVPTGYNALQGKVIKAEERFNSFKLVLAVPPKESSAKEKVPDDEPAAPKTQPHVAIIEAWHYSIPDDVRPIGKPVIERNCKVAKEIAEAGISPWDVVRFVTCTYGTYRVWAIKNKMPKVMKLEHVKEYIRAYLAKEPTNGANKAGVPTGTPSAQNNGRIAGVLGTSEARPSRVPAGALRDIKLKDVS